MQGCWSISLCICPYLRGQVSEFISGCLLTHGFLYAMVRTFCTLTMDIQGLVTPTYIVGKQDLEAFFSIANKLTSIVFIWMSWPSAAFLLVKVERMNGQAGTLSLVFLNCTHCTSHLSAGVGDKAKQWIWQFLRGNITIIILSSIRCT